MRDSAARSATRAAWDTSSRFNASGIASFTFAFGGDIFDYENVAYTYDDPATVEAMSMVQGLFDDGCAPVSSRSAYGDQVSFANGKLLFFIGLEFRPALCGSRGE